MLLPGIIYFIVFHYLPIWGAKLAFENFRIIGANEWVGLKYFKIIFASPIFYKVLWNTIIISIMKLVFFFPVPIILSLMINEVRSAKYRKFAQSIIYLPHFLSWVVIAGIFITILSPQTGAINSIIKLLGFEPIYFMTNDATIRWVLVFSEIWRSGGWDSLIYFAAIMGISPALYDAATMDGASRLNQIRHITLPCLVPTMVTLLILNIGFFMSAGFDQIFNLMNDANQSRIDIIDTYVYRIGIISGEYSYATAVGLFKAVVAMALIMATHFAAKKYSGKGVW